MNSKGIVALADHSTCMKCLKEKATHTYKIEGRGYGSLFDDAYTKLLLCDCCDKDEYKIWFNETPNVDEENYWGEKYIYEEDINNLIKSLPLEGQELFYNSFFNDWFMDAQDWIDYKLDELSHEKCKEYNMYSPQEKRAYKDRFPTCNNVYLRVYSDGSSHCKCDRGAYGKSDGSCDNGTYSHCYQCTSYVPRIDKMKTICQKEEFLKLEESRLKDMLSYATTRLEVLEQGYDQYIEEFGE